MSKKKYILTMIVILQICAILFVVSYAWFHIDSLNKKVQGDELRISTTEDLIMKYKGVTYSNLKLNDVVSSHFTFDQVSSTGLGDQFYKIDYAPKLNQNPAKYIEATANVDYIEMEISLTASSKGKRVYLSGADSGFVIGEPAGHPLKDDTSAVDCMRMSLSYIDNDNNKRYIVFGNNEYKSYVLLKSDLNNKDIKNNPVYINGVPDYYNLAEASGEFEPTLTTGVENVLDFERYDLNADKNAVILFDLTANQTKKINICIWLDGTACQLNSQNEDKVSGRPVTCNLRFSSSQEVTTEMSSKIVAEGMNINTIANTYGPLENQITNQTHRLYKFYIPYSSKYYLLKNDTYTFDGETLKYHGETDADYTKVLFNGKYYYHATNGSDLLYYDLVENQAYVKYGDLQWTLANEIAKTMPDRETGVQTDRTLATLVGNVVQVGAGDIGDTFNLIGYVTLLGEQVNVVNETYIFGNVVEVIEREPIGIQLVGGEYTIDLVSYYYSNDSGFTINLDGEYKFFNYNSENFVWRIERYSTSKVTRTPNTVMTGVCPVDAYGYYYLNKSDGRYVDPVITLQADMLNETFYLVGCYTADINNGGAYQEVVIRILFYFYN